MAVVGCYLLFWVLVYYNLLAHSSKDGDLIVSEFVDVSPDSQKWSIKYKLI